MCQNLDDVGRDGKSPTWFLDPNHVLAVSWFADGFEVFTVAPISVEEGRNNERKKGDSLRDWKITRRQQCRNYVHPLTTHRQLVSWIRAVIALMRWYYGN